MSSTELAPAASAFSAAASWIDALGAALDSGSRDELARLFAEGATWRDMLGFEWDFRNFVGRESFVDVLAGDAALRGARDVSLRTGGATPAFELDNVIAFFTFATDTGRCTGFVRLTPGEAGWTAINFYTQLDEIHGHPESVGARRPVGRVHAVTPGRRYWSEQRAAELEFGEQDPAVVVVGAGHSGLALAARLAALDVPTLVVERNARVGDNWRKRYSSLSLHDPVGLDHLPHLPFSSRWNTFPAKDKFGNYLELYADILDLNVWTGAEIGSASYDEGDGRWELSISRAGRPSRVLRPKHLVIATGLNGEPYTPDIPGLAEFAGESLHASEFIDGRRFAGRRVLVVGAGVTGHDITQDLHENGADVTILQRSSTYVINVDTFHTVFLGAYLEGSPFTTEEADMLGATLAFGWIGAASRPGVEMAKHVDQPLLDRLEAAGFALQYGPTGGGEFELHFAGKDGYYLNIGCSELIADRKVGLVSGAEIDRFTRDAVVLTDGTTLHVDAVIFATGYRSITDGARRLLGDNIMARTLPIYQLQPDGEMGGTWRRSGHDGLWFMTGALPTARHYSKFLALQLKAIHVGVLPYAADPA
jgi:putative flavoprotein involved in K+ transport